MSKTGHKKQARIQTRTDRRARRRAERAAREAERTREQARENLIALLVEQDEADAIARYVHEQGGARGLDSGALRARLDREAEQYTRGWDLARILRVRERMIEDAPRLETRRQAKIDERDLAYALISAAEDASVSASYAGRGRVTAWSNSETELRDLARALPEGMEAEVGAAHGRWYLDAGPVGHPISLDK